MLGNGVAQQGAAPPADAIANGRAYATKITTDASSPNGPTSVTVQPYVRQALAAKTQSASRDAQNRILYGTTLNFDTIDTAASVNAKDVPPVVTFGINNAFSAAFFANNNPYTYVYRIADGGGNFEVSYYSAWTSVAGFTDPNGVNSVTAGRQRYYTFKVPSDQQKLKYPGLVTPTTPVLTPGTLTLNCLPGKSSDGKQKAGAAIGMLYNPGGNDPDPSNLHWIQFFGTSSKSYAASSQYTGDGTGVDQEGGNLTQVAGLDGKTLVWGLDTAINDPKVGDGSANSFLSVHYEGPHAGLGNTSFFYDQPYLNIPPTLAFGDVNVHAEFYLFKMFYTDPVSGLPVANPTPNGAKEVFFTILRQGVTYGFDIINFG